MTQYPAVGDQQFGQLIRDLRARIGVLESRTNAIGTNADGSVTVANLFVVNGTGSISMTPDPNLPTVVNVSPALIISDGLGTSELPPQLYSREVDIGGGFSFEQFVVRGPQSLADTAKSCVLTFMGGAGPGTDAAGGSLSWEQNAGGNIRTDNVAWDQWGVTLEQPTTGSAATNTTIIGSALQNDQWAGSNVAPKFVRMGNFAGTTDASGNLAGTGLGLGFTPTGLVVTRNQTSAGAGPFCASWFNLSSGGFTTHWVNGTTAYATSAVAASFIAFG
jgi:hypothetical protein